MRTVTTSAAQDAARQLQSELSALRTTTDNLLDKGAMLSNPLTWDGPGAQLFRNQLWPNIDQTLRSLGQELTELADTISMVNRRTADAGS
ncbi:pyrophosphorylase [Frankia sp. Cppng1_Ct_nod]|uniref:pyrophosphorylase n=1 Tax=Frankia sp. Cppng1_Ct_nod TaxID=2897162 RepID=UPI00104133AF|nr:pyrophosphorylase [Frankia sp. Cppng1_Ct_nod]